MDRRRLLLACAVAPLAARAQETTITVGLADLQRLAEAQFPLQQGFQGALDATFTNPRLRLVADQGRLGGLFDLAASDRLFGNRWTGRLSLDAVPRWERQDRSVRLAQVRVQRFEVDEQVAAIREQIQRLGPGLAELALEDFSVYTLPEAQQGMLKAMGIEPAEVKVTARGLEIRLAPTKR